MISVTKDWNPKQKKLALLLSKSESFIEGIYLCLEMHNQVHDMEKENKPTIYQQLINGLTSEIIKFRPENNFASIAWNLWHITRIEDAVSNILINNSDQVLNATWMNKLNIKINDTGNAFSKGDVDRFDSEINIAELLKYRKAVGKNTQKILKKLTAEGRKIKPGKEQLDRIVAEGVLTGEKDSIWLLDFWGKKTVSGLLTMPVTRHQIVHINDCFKLKKKYK
ncbi:MAG: DinB family protein [Spirochaetes bacterium]|nr:DinB family protein [Spirochaetota bacterium]